MNSNNFREKISKITQSKTFSSITVGILVIIGAFIVFQAGVGVGFKKASFGKNFDNHYEENFGPEHALIGGPGMPNANGAVGKIISASQGIVSVEESNDIEKSVVVNDQTIIRVMRAAGTPESLVPGTFIVAIGDPNAQGQIVAKFIRIIPAPPTEN